jgi:hypothetical protein
LFRNVGFGEDLERISSFLGFPVFHIFGAVWSRKKTKRILEKEISGFRIKFSCFREK